MRLAVFGGSGRIGTYVLAWSLRSGHDVTGLVRDPAVLAGAEGLRAAPGEPASGLTLVTGDATDPAAVQAVVDGSDAVISALGPRGKQTPGLLGIAARNIVGAMGRSGTRRLICVSAAGAFVAGDPDMNFLIKMILPRVLARQFADVRDMEEAIAASGLDWTLVRPSRLVNTGETRQYRVRPDYTPAGGGKISRADVAHFIEATLVDNGWLRGRPALAY
jgi:putative NADH-flavin reductase